ncbi:MAG: PAS domain S-box protein [Sphingobacteriia bacterium]|nr:PAS domain S-box protein [Sphingobacteriia bacterium]NCC40662.1 PAS domain S-box protein [Gammaproteobacteria bacterium]
MLNPRPMRLKMDSRPACRVVVSPIDPPDAPMHEAHHLRSGLAKSGETDTCSEQAGATSPGAPVPPSDHASAPRTDDARAPAEAGAADTHPHPGVERHRLDRTLAPFEKTLSGVFYEYVLTPEGRSRFLYVGPGCEALLGVASEALLADGDILWRLVHPDDLAWIRESDLRANREADEFQADCRIITPDGQLKWLHIASRPWPAAPGQLAVWYGYAQDITERKRAESELSDLRQALERAAYDVTENIPVGTYTMVLPPGGQVASFSFLSRRFLQMCGLTREEALSDPFRVFAICHPEDRDDWIQGNLTAFKQRIPFVGESRVIIHGQLRWYSAESIPRQLPDGSIVWEGVMIDITERKCAEEQLRQSENRFRDLFEHSPVAYQSLDETGRFIDVNDPLCELLGYPREELLGRSFGALWTEASAHRFPKTFESFKRHGTSSGELDLVRRDGTPIAVLIDGRVQQDTQGRFLRTHCTLFDITERKRHETELEQARAAAEQANQAKGTFLANMSHEIRTPMSGIIGMAQLALRETPDARQRRYLRKIEGSARSLLGILNDILDFSKIEAGKLVIEQIPVDLGHLIESLVHLMEPSARAKGLDFIVAGLPRAPYSFRGDPLRLTQILTNLLSNAIKFTAKGEVCLKIDASRPDRLALAVSDTGIGIGLESLSRIFEPFHQGDTSTTRTFGGTGLGLVISKQLVELMDGRLDLQSTPGQGTCVTVVVPARRCEVAQKSSPCGPIHSWDRQLRPPASPWPEAVGRRVLLVEDHPVNRDIVHGFLEGSGLIIAVARNGQEALDIFRATPCDIILMDIQMPIMDGYEATRRIHALDPRVPIIALTAHAFSEDLDRTRDAGMNEHLTKPIDPEQLQAVLRRYLGSLASDTAPRDPDRAGEQAAQTPSDTPNAPAPLTPQARPRAPVSHLDPRVGLSLMGGNQKLYRKILADFSAHYAELQLDPADPATRRTLHSLKGLSANIGAARLQTLAAALETDWDDTRHQQLRQELTAVLEAIRDLLYATPAATPSTPVVAADPQRLADLLEELHRHAESRSSRACRAVLERLDRLALSPTQRALLDRARERLARRDYPALIALISGEGGSETWPRRSS